MRALLACANYKFPGGFYIKPRARAAYKYTDSETSLPRAVSDEEGSPDHRL